MLTETGTTEAGEVIVNLVKAPVTTFEQDYSMLNTESHRTGMVLRREAKPCVERCVFEGMVSHHDEFVIPAPEEPYQGAITRAEVFNAERVNLYGLSDFNLSHRSLIAELHEGQTKISSPVYDSYMIGCESIPDGIGEVSLFTDVTVSYETIGHILTRDYSSLHLQNVDRIGSIYALTLEPKGTRIRFAMSFDNHQSYYVFHRKDLIPIEDDPKIIAANGNDRNDICYGFRNMKPDQGQVVDFKIILQSDNPDCTPVFYGFRCSLYSTIRGM